MAMNREIKFRFYMQHDETGRITSRAFSLQDIENGILENYYHDDLGYRYGDTPIFKAQYTGLKDKNGVEIYESDIVSVCFNIEEHPQEKVIVEWDTDSYVVKHKISDEFKNIYSLRAIVYECEVIGNIYENKELLENR